MIDAAHASAILARISLIPIFETLRMHEVVLDVGRCDVRVPRQRIYDGVYESDPSRVL